MQIHDALPFAVWCYVSRLRYRRSPVQDRLARMSYLEVSGMGGAQWMTLRPPQA